MRDLVNLRYNLDDPDAPSRGQVFSLPAWRHKRWAAARREGLQADALDEALMALRHDFRAAPPFDPGSAVGMCSVMTARQAELRVM